MSKNKKPCPLCSKEFQSQRDLERHCEKIHGKSLYEILEEQQTLVIGDVAQVMKDE